MTVSALTGLQQELQYAIDHKTKPPGSLGRLESIALQAGMIQQTVQPVISNPHIVVFAGDHGIAATGLVNPYPQAVTAQMVLNFLNGGAAISVLCRLHQIRLLVVDAGVNADFGDFSAHSNFIPAKIAYGTHNYLHEKAMSPEAMQAAIDKGKAIVAGIEASGCNCIGFGEMGIGNTSSAALIMSSVTGLPVKECTGSGTGANEQQLAIKIKTLQQAYQVHAGRGIPGMKLPVMDTLQCFGGFEIAMMTGAYLEAANRDMLIVVDGFISTAALLLAQEIDNAVLKHCVFAHASSEQAHKKMLTYLDAQPLFDLQMRLGEGTGAALAIPLIRSAVQLLGEMASFESAGVSDKTAG